MQVDVLSELTLEQSEQWQAFLRQARTSHPEQDPRFAEVLRAQGFEPVFARGHEDGVLRAVGLIALRCHPFLKGRYSDAMAYSGPVCDDLPGMTAFLTALADHPAMAAVGRLRVTPYWLEEEGYRIMAWLGEHGWRPFEYGPMRHTGLIDLSGSDDDLLARFSQTCRRKIRKAEKLGLTVRVGLEGAGADDFRDRLNSHHQNRRIATIPPPMFQALQRGVLGPADLGSIIAVHHDQRFLAGIITYRSPTTAHFMHSVHDDAALAKLDNLRIAPFLLLQSMKWSKSMGCETYDIEGYIPDAPPDHPQAHVYRYKSEFNPRLTMRVAGNYLVLDRALHVTGNWREILRLRVRALKGLARRLRAGTSAPAQVE